MLYNFNLCVLCGGGRGVDLLCTIYVVFEQDCVRELTCVLIIYCGGSCGGECNVFYNIIILLNGRNVFTY